MKSPFFLFLQMTAQDEITKKVLFFSTIIFVKESLSRKNKLMEQQNMHWLKYVKHQIKQLWPLQKTMQKIKIFRSDKKLPLGLNSTYKPQLIHVAVQPIQRMHVNAKALHRLSATYQLMINKCTSLTTIKPIGSSYKRVH